MTAAVAVDTIDIPISNLIVSKRNVRKAATSKERDAELLAGIRALGLLQPLVVIPADGKEPGTYEVVAGKRRLKALQVLAKESDDEAGYTAPCRVLVGGRDNLEEISLIENLQRESMHPADEFEAFSKLQRGGASVDDIALHFGITDRLVKQRLRLAEVAPVIIKAYRAGEMSLEAVMAFTVEDDKQRQVAMYEELRAAGRLSSYSIRSALKGDTLTDDAAIVQFVGHEAYVRNGGATSHDLFEETIYYSDVELLKALAMDKLQAAAEEIEEGWNWVETFMPENLAHPYAPLTPASHTLTASNTKATKELLEQQASIDQQIRALESIGDYDDEEETQLTDEQERQLEELQNESAALDLQIVASRRYKPKEMALAGVLVTFNHRGKLDIRRGLVRKQDQKKLAALTKPGKSKDDDAGDPGEDDAPPATAEDYSVALVEDLTTYRLNIAKRYLAVNEDIARDLLVFTLCEQMSGENFGQPLSVRISETRPADGLNRADTSEAMATLQRLREDLPLDWQNIEDDLERFKAFTALELHQKNALMAYCVALSLDMPLLTLSDDAIIEHALTAMDIPWHREFKPTVENYFGRISKDQLIEHGRPFMDDDWPARAAKRSKKELAAELEVMFSGQDQDMPVEKRAAAMDWVPPGFKPHAQEE